MFFYWLSYGLLSIVIVAFAASFLLRLFTPQKREVGFPRVASPNEAQRRHIAYAGTASAHLMPNAGGNVLAVVASSIIFPLILLVISVILTAYAYAVTASLGILFLLIPVIYTLALLFTGNHKQSK